MRSGWLIAVIISLYDVVLSRGQPLMGVQVRMVRAIDRMVFRALVEPEERAARHGVVGAALRVVMGEPLPLARRVVREAQDAVDQDVIYSAVTPAAVRDVMVQTGKMAQMARMLLPRHLFPLLGYTFPPFSRVVASRVDMVVAAAVVAVAT